tara:strand:+ start:799 stop:960 length:162 start_codon:yes stop_codon:yes gene_type:complete
MSYKLIKDPLTGRTDTSVLRKSDSASIVMSDDNLDYLEYKAWLEAGNTPEEAD